MTAGCVFCESWAPQYRSRCGHYLIDGQVAPAGYMPRWFAVFGYDQRVAAEVMRQTRPFPGVGV